MKSFRPQSTSDQLAEHLRNEIHSGRLSGTMPGVKQLVQALGVNSVAVAKAVQELELDGLVVHQGDRRRRLIAKGASGKHSALRIGIMHYDDTNFLRHDALFMMQELATAGHSVVKCSKGMQDLGMDPVKVARLAKSKDVDAWIVYAGSREILEWFSRQGVPVFGLYGRHNSLPIAGLSIHKTPVISTLVSKLVPLGHSRIVMLTRSERRKPNLGLLEQFLIDELQSNGIHTGAFNIPDWEDGPEGLGKIIDSLFRVTPPTALIVGDSVLFHAVQMELAKRGVFAPQHISLFCNEFEQSFKWTQPEISHISWDYRPIIRTVIKWANNISTGKKDIKKRQIKAVFYQGGTLGLAPKGHL